MPVHAVECCNPSCPVNPVADSTVSESAAIQAWNTRAESTCSLEVHDSLFDSGGIGDVWVECTACGWQISYKAFATSLVGANYCPRCGAKVVK